MWRKDRLNTKTFALGRIALRTALCCGTTLAAPCALAVELVDGATAYASDDTSLESVLIATRSEKPDPDNPSTPTLEPISQLSDYEPELADPPADEQAAPETGAAAPGEREPSEPRVASLPADGATALSRAVNRPSTPRPARFHGVLPGESTRHELIESWGEPDQAAVADGETTGGEVLRYELKPFKSVETLIEENTVRVIRVTFAERATVADLTERLALTEIEPVEVIDPESGELLAVAFPEKGLTLLTAPATAPGPIEVSHLVLEPLDSRAFTLRAQGRDASAVKLKLADLRRAVEIDPGNAHAHWLAAGEHRSVGQAKSAEASAGKAVELDGENPAFRLRWAETLTSAGRYDEAVFETRKVLDQTDAAPIVRAEALYRMGELASMGEASIAEKAIGFHNSAIEIADGLATSNDSHQRHAAKDLLVRAHLAVANEIARRDYPQKSEVVAEWIGRASGLAEARIENDGGGLELRLTVAREALSALSQMRPAKDPSPWIREAQETADALLAASDDPLFRARVVWELGEAYQHAVRIEHARGDADRALGYGSDAIDRLSSGAEPRASSPDAEQLVGRLYFYLGAVNAVVRQDHEEAVGWYEKARPILTAEKPENKLVAPRREGEQLVSMAVSYWRQDQRELAIELTTAGAKLMERGVATGVLKESALAVPYGNLASMHETLGNNVESVRFAKLARRYGGPDAAPEPSSVASRSSETRNNQRATTPNDENRTRQARRPTNRRTTLR